MFESTGVAIVFLDRDFLIRSFTPAATRIFKLISSDRGRPLTDISNNLAKSGDLQRDVQSVFEQGQPIERRVQNVDGQTHYVMRILPYRDEHGTANGTIIVLVDVTRLVEHETRQRAILEELNTAVRNVLARIARLSETAPTRDWSAEQFQDAFVGRLHALTACYGLLAQEKWSAIALADILRSAFTAKDPADAQRRITMDGPAVRIAAPQTLALAMVMHELASEAVRSGALSAPDGRVAVDWQIRHRRKHGDVLEVEWHETGGPAVTRPRGKSFGRGLIEQEVEKTLRGTLKVSYPPTGLLVRLSIPLDREGPAERIASTK